MAILVIDNYDSFTFNLVHLIEKHADEDVIVFRNDQIGLAEVSSFGSIVISPGPGLPRDAGITNDVIREFSSSKKILGVCLGHQAIAEVFGGQLKNLETVRHGIGTLAEKLDEEEILFNTVPSKFEIGHYHSWVVDYPVPKEFIITSRSDDGEIMSIRHRQYNLRSVQFHPESVLTPLGEIMLKNWIMLC